MASTKATIHVSAKDVPAVRSIIRAAIEVIVAGEAIDIADDRLRRAHRELRRAMHRATWGTNPDD